MTASSSPRTGATYSSTRSSSGPSTVAWRNSSARPWGPSSHPDDRKGSPTIPGGGGPGNRHHRTTSFGSFGAMGRWCRSTSTSSRLSTREAGLFLAYLRDITERKKAEEQLRQSEEKYRHLVDRAPAGIYQVDFRSRRFISVNDVMCQYTGYTRDEFLALDPLRILTEDSWNPS